MHFVTIAYRESEAATWQEHIPTLLASFRFSRASGTAQPRLPSQVQEPLGFLFGLILSWSIGLAPALIYRYAIFERPIEKQKVFWRLAPGVVVLMFAFKLTVAELNGTQPNPNPGPWIIIYYVGKWIMSRGNVKGGEQTVPESASVAGGTGESGGWFYKVDDEVFGPVTHEELRQKAVTGKVGPETLIRSGGRDWRRSEHIYFLSEFFAPLNGAEDG